MNDNTKRSSRRVKGIIAGAAGVALLLGGSTFALWTAADTINGSGNIKTGTMSVAKDGDVAVYDVSADRTNVVPIAVLGKKGQDVTQGAKDGTLEIVPGDELAAVYPFTFNMVGDNLVGKLSLMSNNVPEAITGVTFGYTVKVDGVPMASSADGWVPNAETSLGFYGNVDDEDAGVKDVTAVPENGSEITVIVTVKFDSGVTAVAAQAIQALQNLTVQLDQVRTADKGYFGTPAT
jgi:alternate signal-mediated exported protein